MGASAILVAHGPLRKRVAATLTDFVYRNGGRIRYHDQYVDPETQRYYTRLEWDLAGFAFPREAIGERFREAVGERFDMDGLSVEVLDAEGQIGSLPGALNQKLPYRFRCRIVGRPLGQPVLALVQSFVACGEEVLAAVRI